MILAIAAKGKKTIAYTMLALMYFETIVPSYALGASRITYPRITVPVDKNIPAVIKPVAAVEKAEGGPTQPESQQFSSVNSDNMVDLFTGDLSYSIPLLDVGGYPLAIGYNSGISMDQEASWTGLGWNINPGAITRNMRGLPDDFNGLDSIKKTATVKENKTIGGTGGADIELMGAPIGVSASLGVFHNTYRGWGVETSLGASITAGAKNAGSLTAGLSLTDNSQEGLSISPSLQVKLNIENAKHDGGFTGNLSTSVSYNTRSGLKALQYSGGVNAYKRDLTKVAQAQQTAVDNAAKKEKEDGLAAGSVTPKAISGWTGMSGYNTTFSSSISYAFPSYTPTISMPFTSKMLTITAKVGFEQKVLHPSFFVSGYTTKQYIADDDKVLYLPAYGYLNYQNGVRNPGALLDFNREREVTYREKPAIPNIAVPGYTYDVFSISGEGIGGTFRAYRGDIGFVYDHSMRTRDGSTNISGDVGFGDLLHLGASVSYTRAFTETGPWRIANPLANTVGFTNSDKTYEAVYFKNPGEKTINTSSFYDAVGGDSVVIPKLYQSGDNTPDIATTNYLTKYGGGKKGTDVLLTKAKAVKPARDKRTQVISYLTANEATTVGASVYIENYPVNKFQIIKCGSTFSEPTDAQQIGFRGDYYSDQKLNKYIFTKIDTSINFIKKVDMQAGTPVKINENFSVRWTSRLKAPVTGKYTITLRTDDGACLKVNDTAVMNFWTGKIATRTHTINLEEGQIYNIQLEYFNGVGEAAAIMKWNCDTLLLTAKDFFLPTQQDTFDVAVNDSFTLHKELRVNAFRKANHISEIDVLNTDGQRYFYGLPVYNLKQKEATFSVNSNRGNIAEGTVAYNDGADNTIENVNGNDRYFTSEEVPAYAHSFLLTGIVSPDYVDITGNGISDDDPGNAVKFNYSKVAGAKNSYKWRTPYSKDASYNQGLKSDSRDDKGYYVYGEKELWYLNSIESKNMIATFTVENRDDLSPINEKGEIDTGSHVAKRLKEINLYTKADFLKRNTKATPVKTVHFEYSYELCKGINGAINNKGKLTLKSIWFSYNGNKKGKKNAYVFNYNSKNPGYDHKSFDRWGNYKDAADNPGYAANNIVTNAEHPYALQDSAKAAANAAAWTLDSIKLPSGGGMKITYESDDYAYVQHHRAARMFNVAGFSYAAPLSKQSLSPALYSGPVQQDNLFVAVDVPEKVSSDQEVYNKYLAGLDTTIAFRLHVQMPSDKFGSGYEFVPSYGRLEKGSYGFINNGNTIWFKIQGITKKGERGGNFSPMARAAVQFLRINLPSKAYPGSDVGDDLDLADGVKVLTSLAGNIKNAFSSFDETARESGWSKNVDLSRSFVRLNDPTYKKYGNGLRVKRIVISDNWNEMTKKERKGSVYGTEYSYTTVKNIDGVDRVISSGVATYEPVMGSEENPLRVPVEYLEQVSAWAPTDLGYVETPLGESFYPAASVGYSKVRTRSIHTKNIRSATGYEETNFYTSYDFPTISDNSLLDNDTKRRYKPGLANFLRIRAKHHLVMSQGFKVELNDMNGKVMSHYSYPENDTNYTSGTINHYHLDDDKAAVKHLNNTVFSMNAAGEIDATTSIGKDIELMMDMREQKSSTNGMSVDANVELISFGIPPVLVLPMVMLVPQSEETLFRSVAATKVISRHCILDSLEAFDKGSRVVTKNMLYDGETGEVILTGTQNEFGDTIYQFNYPAGWIYEGMSGAYKNINATLSNVNIKAGKIISNVSDTTIASCFTSGDEILIYARTKITETGCSNADSVLARFSSGSKIWAVDVNELKGGSPDIYFMQQDGTPYTGSDVTMKVVRSGRKNIAASAGSVSMMKNPLVKVGNKYQLIIDKDSKIISAGVVEYGENWQVEDRKKQKTICAY